jgi:hypothetical protein
MAIEVSKKIEIRDTGVSVTFHKVVPNVFYNIETKMLQANLQSFAQKDKSPLRVKPFRIKIADSASIESEIIKHISNDDNLDIIINGVKPKSPIPTNKK